MPDNWQDISSARPAMPDGEKAVWYRGWECAFDWQSEYWCGAGYSACLGGADLDCIQLHSDTWAGLLDEVDDYMDELPSPPTDKEPVG